MDSVHMVEVINGAKGQYYRDVLAETDSDGYNLIL